MTDIKKTPHEDKDDEAVTLWTQEHATKPKKPWSFDEDEEQQDKAPIWLITFTDVMALMLTFFVLLFSMKVPDNVGWDKISSALQSEFNQFYSPTFKAGAQDTLSLDKLDRARGLPLNYLYNLMNNLREEEDSLSRVTLNLLSDRIVISLPYDLLFAPGAVELQDSGKDVLFTLANHIRRVRNRAEFIGHADPDPILNSERFQSNWDLSLMRAIEVAAFFHDAGYERDAIVRGLSSAYFEELPESLSVDARMQLSRRVDLVIFEDDGRVSRGLFGFSP